MRTKFCGSFQGREITVFCSALRGVQLKGELVSSSHGYGKPVGSGLCSSQGYGKPVCGDLCRQISWRRKPTVGFIRSY